jgi:lysophospholipase L1-like esterase
VTEQAPPTELPGAGESTAPVFRRFVAIGDSTTEGLNDPTPTGGYVGWADRLAARLAERNPGLEYANLAVRGRQASEVRAEQFGAALALRPDLVSIIAGVNDLLRPRSDPAEVTGHLDAMFAAAVASGATVLTITQPDPVSVNRVARPIRGRLLIYNEGIRACARRYGLILVDFARIPEATHPLFWSVDRLHLNTLGHTRMAATVAAALGLPAVPGVPGVGAAAGSADPLPPVPVLGRRAALTQDAVWLRRYFAPWVWRHLLGHSSGDGVVAKRPILGPIGVPSREQVS